MQKYNITIIGAGPSGLFAAHELSKELGREASIKIFDKGRGIDNRKTCLYDLKDKCSECNPCNITEGVMGAGLKSDGKVHFYKEAIQLWREGVIDDNYCERLLDYIESRFEKWGMENPVYPTSTEEANLLVDKVKSLRLPDQFELQVKKKVRHIGSDNLPRILTNMLQDIQESGDVKIYTQHDFCRYDATGKKIQGVYFSNGKHITADHYIISLGRRGVPLVQKMIRELNIPFAYKPVELGGRIEVPARITAEFTDILYNLAFRQKSDRTKDISFTFCTNPYGYVVAESILPGIIGVNGESRTNERSLMTNFALLTELPIPEGEDPNTVLSDILFKKFTNGDSRVYVQSLNRFMGENQTGISRYCYDRTLKSATETDLNVIFPQRITESLKIFINNLSNVFPDIVGPESFFYAPEAKIRGIRVLPESKDLETTIENLSLTGDSSGLSGNIVDAALTGILAARGIISKIS